MAATTESNPASGAAVEGAYVLEAAWGTTPTTPDLQALRFTSLKLSMGPQYATIPEKNAKRVRRFNEKISHNPSFEIRGPMIYGNIDDLLQSVFGDEWGADVLTQDNVYKSFTLEKKYGDAATPFYEVITGCVVTNVSLEVNAASNDPVMFTITGIGKVYTTDTSSLDADGYTAANTNGYMHAVYTSVSVDDSEIGDVTSLSLSFANPHEALPAIGTDGAAKIPPSGVREDSGNATIHLVDRTWKQRMLNGTSFDLDLVLADAATGGNTYAFAMPKCSINGDVDTPDSDASLRQSVPFVAVNSAGNATTTITRAAAA